MVIVEKRTNSQRARFGQCQFLRGFKKLTCITYVFGERKALDGVRCGDGHIHAPSTGRAKVGECYTPGAQSKKNRKMGLPPWVFLNIEGLFFEYSPSQIKKTADVPP